MPIAETPLEHAGDAALAMKWTGEPTVAPLLGLFTVTPARAGSASAHMQTSSFPSFIERSPAFPIGCESSSEVERILGRQLLTLNKKDCRNQSEVHVRGKAKPLANPRSNSWRWLHRWREVRDPHGIQLIGQRPKYRSVLPRGRALLRFLPRGSSAMRSFPASAATAQRRPLLPEQRFQISLHSSSTAS